VGDYRVVFKAEDAQITILGIRHRRDVYKVMTEDRTQSKPRSSVIPEP
jgi:hypothetical protein